MPSIDATLLRPQSQANSQRQEAQELAAQRVGDFREAQGQKAGDEDSERNREMAEQDFNANRQQAKIQQQQEQQKQEASKIQSLALEKSFSAGSSKLLQAAWRNIIATWGASFLYVYVHLFLRNVFGGKMFAPLGSEWFDKPGNPMAARDRLGQKLHLPEMMLVLLVSLILFFAVISFFSIIGLIVEVVKNPLRTILGAALEGIKSFLGV